MNRAVGVRTTLVLILASLLASPAAAQKADETDTFFNGDKVLDITIEIGTKEMESLRRDARTYVKATLKEGDKTNTDVGVHLKGAAGSFRGIDDKAGLTINMDKFVDDQRFHGMDKFHLNNSLQDPSYVSELICGELFRKAGVPASRVGHAVVTINKRKCGLYYIKEGYDTGFLKRHFNNADGNLYDGGFLRDLDQPAKLLSTKNDVKEQTDLKALWTAASERDVKARFAKIEKVLDVDRFISYLVLETITWDWDGYPMNRNNYRMYHDPKTGKLIFIPSGMDQMFADPNGPLFPNFQGAVARWLLETPEGRERYLKRMAEVMKDVFQPEPLMKQLDVLEARLKPVLTAIDAGAGRDLPNQINRLRQGIKQRQKKIEEQLKAVKK
jgi:spore coat protein CotH